MQSCNLQKPIHRVIRTILVIVLLLLAAFFLYIHRTHLAAYSGLLILPLIFMCPLMHLFMHHGHHHHEEHKHDKNDDKQ